MEWIKENFTSIVVVLICILALLLMYGSVKGYQNKANQYCMDQLSKCGCLETYDSFNLNYTFIGGLKNENKNNNSDTKGTG